MKTSFFSRNCLAAAVACALLPGLIRGAEPEVRDFAGVGIVAPRDLALTLERPRATKAIVVVIENRNSEPRTIADAATLANLVALEVEALGAAVNPRSVLIPPRSFPITLRPGQKLSVVFRVTFALDGLPEDLFGFRYAATVDGAPVEPATAAGAGIAAGPVAASSALANGNASGAILQRRSAADSSRITRGADQGATVTPKPKRVPLKKGQSQSDPITFTAKWPGKPFEVSGWSNAPPDDVADPIFEKAHSATATGRWKNPGTYTVTAFLNHFPPGGNFEHARPSEQIHVIKVEFKDDQGNDPEGMKIGVTTGTDRSRTLTATVTPASETNNVDIKVTKGGSNLAIEVISKGNGIITFKAEGIGETGSKAKKDCQIKAEIEGKEAATANVTVVVPKTILSAPTDGPVMVENLAVNEDTSPAFPQFPSWVKALRTFYNIHVPVTVGDQFNELIVDPTNPHLYLGAPVSERFKEGAFYGSPGTINRTIRLDSSYDDPCGCSLPIGPDVVVPANALLVTVHQTRVGPVFPLNAMGTQGPVTIVVEVDGFPLSKAFLRFLDISPGSVSLRQTLVSP